MTMHLSSTDTKIRCFKNFGVTSLTFGVKWRHQSRDHWTRHMWFPIGCKLESCVYLTPLWRYLAPKILGSRLWPFEVTWRHQSRDHWTRRGHFFNSSQWWPCVYLARIRRYGASKILGSQVWFFEVTWRHRHATIGLGVLVVYWNYASILHRYWKKIQNVSLYTR